MNSRAGRLMARAALVVAAMGAIGLAAPQASAQVAAEHVQELRGRHVRWDYAGTINIDDSSYRISTRGCSIDQIAQALIYEGYDVRFVNGWLRVYKDCGGPDLSWCEGQYGLLIRSRRNYYSLALTPADCGRDFGREYGRVERDDRGRRSGGGFYGRFDSGDGSFEIGIGVSGGGPSSSKASDHRLEAAQSFKSGASAVVGATELKEDADDITDHGTAGFKSTREQSGGRTSVGGGKGSVSSTPPTREVGAGKALPPQDKGTRGDGPAADGARRDAGSKKESAPITRAPVGGGAPEKIVVKESDTVKTRAGGSEKGAVVRPMPVQPVVAPSKGQNGGDDRSGSRNGKIR